MKINFVIYYSYNLNTQTGNEIEIWPQKSAYVQHRAQKMWKKGAKKCLYTKICMKLILALLK